MKKLGIILCLIAISAIADVNINKCRGCHGAEFQNKALGKSLVVKDMNGTALYTAISGYKDGTYGGTMKGIMKAQLMNMDTNETVNAVLKVTKAEK